MKALRSILVVAVATAIPLLLPVPAQAVACNVPSATYPSLQSAENDPNCDPIIVGAGSFANVVIDRDVTIDGAGPELTMLDSGAAIRIRVQGGSPTVTIRDLTVTGADQSILNDGQLTVENIVSRNNSTCCGGAGIFNSTDATLTVLGSTIRDNDVTSGNGGAINSQFNTTVTIEDSTINGNDASGFGGAIYFVSGTLTITNTTIHGNGAGSGGGGINTTDPGASVSLTNVTVTGNTADADAASGGDGGGVNQGSGVISIRSSVVAGNTDASPGAEAPDCAGSPVFEGYNVIGNTTGCGYTAGTGDRTGVDPRLAPLGSYGGHTETRPPLPGSPAMEIVPPGQCTDGSVAITTDQRGFPRPIDGDQLGIAECDAGAAEFVPREVELRAKNKVKKGKKVKLTAEVSPCFGHQGDVVHFMKKSKEIVAVPLDADCTVSTKTKVRKKTTYRAELREEGEHAADGDPEKVKVKKRK